MINEILCVIFLCIGTFFVLVGSIGLVRLPDTYMRMHALTKSVTLGVAGILVASVFALLSWEVTLKVFLALAFHFLTNPVGAHMIARAAFHHNKVPFWKNTFAEEWKEKGQ